MNKCKSWWYKIYNLNVRQKGKIPIWIEKLLNLDVFFWVAFHEDIYIVTVVHHYHWFDKQYQYGSSNH